MYKNSGARLWLTWGVLGVLLPSLTHVRHLTAASVPTVPAEPRRYVSCVWGTDGGRAVLVEYSAVFTGLHTPQDCNARCFERGDRFVYHVGFTSVCYCGDQWDRPTCSCDDLNQDSPPATGEDFCGREYVHGASPTSADLDLYDPRPHTTWEPLALSVRSSVRPSSYLWTCNDTVSSAVLTTDVNSIIFKPTLPGQLNVSVDIVAGNGTDHTTATIPLLTPVTLAEVTAPQYSDLDQPAKVSVEILGGSDARVHWTREDENGTIVQGG